VEEQQMLMEVVAVEEQEDIGLLFQEEQNYK
jgi:hypothetical protein